MQKSRKSKGDVTAGAQGAKKLTATYQLPYWKHAPIGPTMALAEYRPDGSVTVHTHTQNAQALRGQLAMMLGTSVDKVTVKTYAGAGHYGRSNGGNAGAEDEAVLLSKEVGKPVRVQWMRDDDMKWSTQSPAAYADVNISLDEHGRIAAYEIDHYQPAMQDDRLIGAVLAGLPTMPAPSERAARSTTLPTAALTCGSTMLFPISTNAATGRTRLASKVSAGVGLRDHSMRTPGQFQQNFPREMAMNEAAALAGADPLQFRIDHAKEERLLNVLRHLQTEAGWETTLPNPKAAASDSTVRGQGMSAMFRSGTYWACACDVRYAGDWCREGGKVHGCRRARYRRQPGTTEAAGGRRRGHGYQYCPARGSELQSKCYYHCQLVFVSYRHHG